MVTVGGENPQKNQTHQPSGCEAVVLTTTLPRHGYVCHKHFNHIDEAKVIPAACQLFIPSRCL